MSKSDPLDLQSLRLVPDWVSEPADPKKYENAKGERPREHRKGPQSFDRGGRGGGGDRRGGGGDRRGGGGDRRGGGGQRRHYDNNRTQTSTRTFDKNGQRVYTPAPPEGLSVTLSPNEDNMSSLVDLIKQHGRTYSVFDLAHIVIKERNRYKATIKRDNAEAPTLIQCADGSLWLTREEAINHLSTTDLVDSYFEKRETETEGPKGNFTSVAVCDMTNVILGPPNHHAYQTNLMRHYNSRFKSKFSLENYKRRVRNDRSEEVINQWKEEQKKQAEYVSKDVPEGEEPKVFKTREEAIRHLLLNKSDDVLKARESATIEGDIPARSISPALLSCLRREADGQRRYPGQLAHRLIRQLERKGLKVFKIGRKKTYTARTRPRPLSPGAVLSEKIQHIVAHLKENEKATMISVVSTLIPEGTAATHKEEGSPTLTDPELEVIRDLRWLMKEGYLIEFNDGKLKLSEAELHKPAKKAAKKAPKQKKESQKPAATVPAPTTGSEKAPSETTPVAAAATPSGSVTPEVPTQVVASEPEENASTPSESAPSESAPVEVKAAETPSPPVASLPEKKTDSSSESEAAAPLSSVEEDVEAKPASDSESP